MSDEAQMGRPLGGTRSLPLCCAHRPPR